MNSYVTTCKSAAPLRGAELRALALLVSASFLWHGGVSAGIECVSEMVSS